MRACSDIANALIQEYEAQQDSTGRKKDINLNRLRGQIAKKHYLSHQPPLTAIISAVPEHYKKYILPKLIAKPISECGPGVEVYVMPMANHCNLLSRNFLWYRRRGGDVQASPLPTYSIHRKYLRLLPWRPRLGFRILDAVVHWL